MMNQSQRDDLIVSHLPQVELLAKRLQRRCPQVELDDLIQAGTIGLIRAVDRFDPARGCLLKTIAEHKIRGALLDYLRHIDPLPRHVRRFQKQRDSILSEMERAGADVHPVPAVVRLLLGVAVVVLAGEHQSRPELLALDHRVPYQQHRTVLALARVLLEGDPAPHHFAGIRLAVLLGRVLDHKGNLGG